MMTTPEYQLGGYRPSLVIELACTCLAAALLNLLLPRYPAEAATPAIDLVTALPLPMEV